MCAAQSILARVFIVGHRAIRRVGVDIDALGSLLHYYLSVFIGKSSSKPGRLTRKGSNAT